MPRLTPFLILLFALQAACHRASTKARTQAAQPPAVSVSTGAAEGEPSVESSTGAAAAPVPELTETPVIVSTEPLRNLYFVRKDKIIADYLDALANKPELKEAYDGFFNKPAAVVSQMQKLRKSFNKLIDLAAIYPLAAPIAAGYRGVTRSEEKALQFISKEDKYALWIQKDFEKALLETVKEHRADLIYDQHAAGVLFLRQDRDLSPTVLENLLEIVRLQVEEKEKAKKKEKPEEVQKRE